MSDHQGSAAASEPGLAPVHGFSPDQQIKNYETQAREFDQITGLLTQLATMLGMFGLATGAIWLVLVPNGFRLPRLAIIMGFLIHGALGLAAAVYFYGLARTIRQRRIFLRGFGALYYPQIESIGRAASAGARCYLWRGADHRQASANSTLFSRLRELGEPILIWALVAFVAVAADGVLAWISWDRETRKADLCSAGRMLLFEAPREHDFDRAKYLIDKLDCDAVETFEPTLGRQLKPDPWRY